MSELIQPLSDVGPVRHVPAQPRISALPPSFSELVTPTTTGGVPARPARSILRRSEYTRLARPSRRATARSSRVLVLAGRERRRADRAARSAAVARPSSASTARATGRRRTHPMSPPSCTAATSLRCAPAQSSPASGSGSASSSSSRAPPTCSASSTHAPRRGRGGERRRARPGARSDRQGRVLLLRGRERPGAARLLRRHRGRRPIAVACSPGSRSPGGAVAALVAGAVGAVVSVDPADQQRAFELDYDVGRPYAFFLGGLRPLIGAPSGSRSRSPSPAACSTFRSPERQHARPAAGPARPRLPGRVQRALGAGHAHLGPAGGGGVTSEAQAQRERSGS